MVSAVESDLSWFVGNGVMTPAEAENLVSTSQRLCADLAPGMITNFKIKKLLKVY